MAAAIGHRAKVRKGEGLEGIDSQIRGQWSGDRNWASGKALQTELGLLTNVQIAIRQYQPTLTPLPSRTSAYLCAMSRSGRNSREARLLFDDVPRAWFAVLDVAGRGNRYERAALKWGGLAERDIGHLAWLALEWKVFA